MGENHDETIMEVLFCILYKLYQNSILEKVNQYAMNCEWLWF